MSLESDTVAEALSEIRGLLHAFDQRGREHAPPAESLPAAESSPAAESVAAADEPRRTEPNTPTQGAAAMPDPVPMAPPSPAPPSRRNGPAVAALAVAGLVVLGTAGLGLAGGLNLPLLTAGAAGKGQAHAGDGPEAMARAALPPALGVAAAKVARSDPAPGPSTQIGGTAPRDGNAGIGAWRPPPAAGAGTAPPVIAPGAGQRPERTRRGGDERTGQPAPFGHDGAAAGVAPTPAVARQAALVPAGEAPGQPQTTSLGPHAAPARAAQAGRRGTSSSRPFHRNRPARRFSRALTASKDNRLQSRRNHAAAPMGATAWPALARQGRAAMDPPASETDGRAITSILASRAAYPPAAPALARRSRAATPPPAGESGGSAAERFAASREDYPPAAAAEWRRSADWSSRGFPPGPPPPVRTVIEGRLPPFPVPPPPPPPRFRRFDFAAGKPFAVRRRPPFPYQGPADLSPPSP